MNFDWHVQGIFEYVIEAEPLGLVVLQVIAEKLGVYEVLVAGCLDRGERRGCRDMEDLELPPTQGTLIVLKGRLNGEFNTVYSLFNDFFFEVARNSSLIFIYANSIA